MKQMIFSLLLGTALGAAPAFAQSSSDTPSSMDSSGSMSSDSNSSTGADSSSTMSGESGSSMGSDSSASMSGEGASSGMTEEQRVASQNEVRQLLEDAGYSDVSIVNTAYLVRATSPNDETVMMIIDGASGMARAAGMPEGGAQSGSGMDSGNSTTGGDTGSSMSGGSGTNSTGSGTTAN